MKTHYTFIWSPGRAARPGDRTDGTGFALGLHGLKPGFSWLAKPRKKFF